ncbi:FAD-dependent oxidoreductase [Dasania marina]|uniref:FAD-dependent oxidoreductase n=1 Tax=Dasania marina TaxID=471499 RepID=UPI0030D8B85E|tara:strand:+ start:13743 stop:15881 length:2139 start_codon:yes stop_codon:yes gene_type:complete
MPKLYVFLLLIAAVVGFFVFGLHDYVSLEFFNAQRVTIEGFVAEQILLAALAFFLLYVLVAALSLPGAALLTLVAGAVFGFWQGLLLVSFASSIGALLAFSLTRWLFKDRVQKKFSRQLSTINQGIAQEGAFYLFGLRLIPLFPFFIINLLMGLTPIKTWTFYWISQVGMLAGTAVYVNAGTQLAQLETLGGIISAPLLTAFCLLGLFPLIAQKILAMLKARKVYKAWPKPQNFDNNIIVIGAGAGGLVSAYIAAAIKSKVTLIEKGSMGGDCLNTGCVPSKALIRAAKQVVLAHNAQQFGVSVGAVSVDFTAVMARVHKVIAAIAPHDSEARYQSLGVEVIKGEAMITSPYTVEVNGLILSTKNIIVATGAQPFIPAIKGLAQVAYLSSDNLWSLESLPRRLLVLGGGPIGCELSQAFARLGSEVTQVEMLPHLMMKEDSEVSALVEQRFQQEGITVYTHTEAKEVLEQRSGYALRCENKGESLLIGFDEIIIAVGRKANTQGFGLQSLGVALNDNGSIQVNEYLQTNYPNIYAVGDVVGAYQFTHTAAHQAWYASVNALFGVIKRFKADYSVIPWATFIEPEVARVGLNEQEAQAASVLYEVTRYGLDDLDRAIADGQDEGFIKVLTVPGKDKILGVTIVAANAGELIAEFVLAMKHGLGLNKLLGTIHVYPTMMEANKFVAGQWKQAHAPQRLLKLLALWQRWRLGKRR